MSQSKISDPKTKNPPFFQSNPITSNPSFSNLGINDCATNPELPLQVSSNLKLVFKLIFILIHF